MDRHSPKPITRRPDGTIATEGYAEHARDLRARASRAAVFCAFRAAVALAARARTGATGRPATPGTGARRQP